MENFKILKCIDCSDVFSFTVGNNYSFTYCNDPEGYEVRDDNGNKEVFFDTTKMFSELDQTDFKNTWPADHNGLEHDTMPKMIINGHGVW